jgi:hypothetical protein
MKRQVHVDDRDLQLAEEACGRLANMYRNEAQEQPNPITRHGKLGYAAEFERVAKRMRRLREATTYPS